MTVQNDRALHGLNANDSFGIARSLERLLTIRIPGFGLPPLSASASLKGRTIEPRSPTRHPSRDYFSRYVS